MTEVELRITDSASPVLRSLISSLDEELLARYPGQGIFGIDLKSPKVREVTFVVAYASASPVGCGAIRPISSDAAELKRFYVAPAWRGKGVGGRMLIFLEQVAARSGFRHLRLETGPKQPEAVHLYEKNGFYRIPLFGEYVGCPYSICMEKPLLEAQ